MFGHCLLVGTGISMVSTGCYALLLMINMIHVIVKMNI